jgi:SAM-dependent methyltransferase
MKRTNDDRERWAVRHAGADNRDLAPSTWVMAACARIPAHHTIVDIAAGTGRHAAPLARQRRTIIAVDFVELAVQHAVRGHAGVHGVVADVWSLPLRTASIHALVIANFLERALFKDLKALLSPGGFLVYETYTVDHRQLVEAGRARAPRCAAHLLEPGELAMLVAPFAILEYREGYVNDEAGERYCASVFAREPGEEQHADTQAGE